MKKRNLGFVLSGLLMGALVGVACEDDTPATDDIGRACTNHCERWAECDDDVDFDGCLANCFNAINECPIEEVDEAIAELDDCTDESCEDLAQCSVDPASRCLLFDRLI